MADQKTDDTKSPLARRGPRPFAGPGSAPSAARPFLRPAAPSQRPTAAPFAPIVVPTRPALGGGPPLTARQPTPIVTPSVPPAATSLSAAQPLATKTAEAVPVAPPTTMPDADPFFGGVPVESVAGDVEPPATRPRPITSEMVALDAFDAFDSVWETAERHARTEPSAAEPTAELHQPAAPLDELSLGGASEAQHAWAEDITVQADPASAMPTPTEDEPTHPTPGFAMPAWLADDSEASRASAPASEAIDRRAADDQEIVDAEQTPWPIVASDYGYSAADWADASAAIPAADDLAHHSIPEGSPEPSLGETAGLAMPSDESWSQPPTPGDDGRPRFELVEDTPIGEPNTRSATDPRVLHLLRISASFDRLAERVRHGEIDVSSIAPEATDAAVLASVLAALLGGSSSR